MADDLDGVNLTSAVRQYSPGDQYRVKETDPDEAGGGRDFYDGFMRKKKQHDAGDKNKPSEEDPQPPLTENPIPVVEQEIHDDVILSRRAQQLIGQLEASGPAEKKQVSPDILPPVPPEPPGRIQFQA